MVIRPTMLLYCHGLNYQLLKYLPYRFNLLFGLDQVVLVTEIAAMSRGDPELYSHINKKGGNSLIQEVKAWSHLLS